MAEIDRSQEPGAADERADYTTEVGRQHARLMGLFKDAFMGLRPDVLPPFDTISQCQSVHAAVLYCFDDNGDGGLSETLALVLACSDAGTDSQKALANSAIENMASAYADWHADAAAQAALGMNK